MKKQRVFFDDWVVVDYIKNQGKDGLARTKNFELVVAVALNTFCEKQFYRKCWIGLQLQEKYYKDVPNFSFVIMETLEHVINRMVEESTDIDITIAIKPEERENTSKGIDFQIKRFSSFVQQDGHKDTQNLIDFLNGLGKIYPRTETELVVCMKTVEEIDLFQLRDSINTSNHPFKKIILIESSGGLLNFYCIWPESCYSAFNLTTMKFDF